MGSEDVAFFFCFSLRKQDNVQVQWSAEPPPHKLYYSSDHNTEARQIIFLSIFNFSAPLQGL